MTTLMSCDIIMAITYILRVFKLLLCRQIMWYLDFSHSTLCYLCASMYPMLFFTILVMMVSGTHIMDSVWVLETLSIADALLTFYSLLGILYNVKLRKKRSGFCVSIFGACIHEWIFCIFCGGWFDCMDQT